MPFLHETDLKVGRSYPRVIYWAMFLVPFPFERLEFQVDIPLYDFEGKNDISSHPFVCAPPFETIIAMDTPKDASIFPILPRPLV